MPATEPLRPRPSRLKTADSGASVRVRLRRVPGRKKPRARPPLSFRDKLGCLHGVLPPYSGPYAVGIMEIEVPVQSPRTFYKHEESGISLNLETVLIAIYYPAALGTGHGRAPDGSRKWSRQLWLPRPRAQVAKGYGKFAGIGLAGIPLFLLTTWFTKLPAFRNAQLADYWPAPQSEPKKSKKDWNQEGVPPEGESERPKFPLMMFSHGLGGSRTSYSSLCGEFASYGFVVCAVEHRDGSGVRTFVNKDDPRSESESDLEDAVQDYIYPPDNPNDTSPTSESGIDFKLRKSQLRMRLAEISEAYKVVKQICRGKGRSVARKNLRVKGRIGASSKGLTGVDWDEWRDRVYLDNVTMVGHSFGAATTVEVLRSSEGFEYISQGIIYDIWAIPIKKGPGDTSRIHRPLLAINSEAFMYWQQNFDTITELVNEAKSANVPAWSLTVRGSVHISHSDFSILYPRLCALSFGMTVNPRRALDLNVGASLEFLHAVARSQARTIVERTMRAEGLLALEVIEELPENGRPVEESDLGYRIAGEAVKGWRWVRRRRVEHVELREELWVHLATTPEELERWEEND